IVDEMLLPHRDSLRAAEAARFDATHAKLKASVAEHQKWLDTVLVPNARGDFRLGPRLYDKKVRFALDSPLTRHEIKARATRGVAVAYCDSPGPLDKELATFFMVSPLPADWTDAQVASFLREYNSSMIHDLTAHEAMPGHYLQGFHANRSQSLLRAVLASGPFVEGWAVYGEGMMADLGYLDGDPLFRLSVLKMRLRAIVNSLLDIGIQTEGMTREQAMDLMTRTAFQQEREASGKWTRATLGSTQLLSYFVGYSEIMELREEAKRRQVASFSLKAFNDALLAHGSPP